MAIKDGGEKGLDPMNRTQRLGFMLTGCVFLVCGIVMTVLGLLNSVVSLWAAGISSAISGIFWLGISAIESRKKSGQ